MDAHTKEKSYKSYREYSFDRNNKFQSWVRLKERFNRQYPFENEILQFKFIQVAKGRLVVLFKYKEVREKILKSFEWERMEEILIVEDKEFLSQLKQLPLYTYPPRVRG